MTKLLIKNFFKKVIFFIFLTIQMSIFAFSRPLLSSKVGQSVKNIGTKIVAPLKTATKAFKETYNDLKKERENTFKSQLVSDKPLSYGLVSKRQKDNIREEIYNNKLNLEQRYGYRYEDKDLPINVTGHEEIFKGPFPLFEKNKHDLLLESNSNMIQKLNNFKPKEVFEKSAYYTRNAGDVFKVLGRGFLHSANVIKNKFIKKKNEIKDDDVGPLGDKLFENLRNDLNLVQNNLQKLKSEKDALEKRIEIYQKSSPEEKQKIKETAYEKNQEVLRNEKSSKKEILEIQYNDPEQYIVNLEKINKKILATESKENRIMRDIKLYKQINY